MKKFFGKIRLIWDILLTFVGVIRLIFKPDDISPIFRVKSLRNHKSFALSLASMRADPRVKALIDERYLSPKPYDLEELRKRPEGSLGRVYAEHMIAYKLKVEFYPPIDDRRNNDDIVYLRNRARQTHDIWHVVCDFPAEPIGEMAVSAFYLAQHQVPLSAILIGTGFLFTIFREPHRVDELVNAIFYGWNMGKAADPLFSAKWEEIWDMPIDEVRARFKIQIRPNFFTSNRAPEARVAV